jgi:hypothetical protein
MLYLSRRAAAIDECLNAQPGRLMVAADHANASTSRRRLESSPATLRSESVRLGSLSRCAARPLLVVGYSNGVSIAREVG